MFHLNQVYHWEEMREWEEAGNTGMLNGVQVFTGERPTRASLGGNENNTLSTVVKNKKLGEYSLTFTHNIDWLAPLQEDINNCPKVFTSVKIDQRLFVKDRTLKILKPITFYGTAKNDFYFVKGKPNCMINYNFETIKNIQSYDTLESYKAMASDLVEDKIQLQEKLRNVAQKMQVMSQ